MPDPDADSDGEADYHRGVSRASGCADEDIREITETGNGAGGVNTQPTTKLLKRCPRCGGNIFLDKDHDGWYYECLQCSYRRDIVLQPGVPKK